MQLLKERIIKDGQVRPGNIKGGQELREMGCRLESLAIVDGMDPETGTVTFR